MEKKDEHLYCMLLVVLIGILPCLIVYSMTAGSSNEVLQSTSESSLNFLITSIGIFWLIPLHKWASKQTTGNTQ